MKQTHIYTLKDPRNGIIKYVGKSNNPQKRYSCHLSESRLGKKTKKCDWIRKLLENNLKPILEIIETCKLSKWQSREIYWIKKIKPICNLTKGGDGMTINPQIIQSKIVIQYDLDGNFVQEYASINEASRQTGLELANISNACNGKLKQTGFFVWRIKGQAYIETKKRAVKVKDRVVNQYELDGTLINTYESIRNASTITGIPRTSISNCCFRNIDSTYSKSYGFIWTFKHKVHII